VRAGTGRAAERGHHGEPCGRCGGTPMKMDANTANAINAVVSALPSIIAAIKAHHGEQHPGTPPLTDAEALAALHPAVDDRLGKDAALLKTMASASDLGMPHGSVGE